MERDAIFPPPPFIFTLYGNYIILFWCYAVLFFIHQRLQIILYEM